MSDKHLEVDIKIETCNGCSNIQPQFNKVFAEKHKLLTYHNK